MNQNSYKTKEIKLEKSIKYYCDTIYDSKNEGYCRICGSYSKLSSVGRHNFILAGSNQFINFSHGFEQGLQLCPSCLTKLLFVPFGTFKGFYVNLISPNSHNIRKYIKEKITTHYYQKLWEENLTGDLYQFHCINTKNNLYRAGVLLSDLF